MTKCGICGGKIEHGVCLSCGSRFGLLDDSEDDIIQFIQVINQFTKKLGNITNHQDKIDAFEKIQDQILHGHFEEIDSHQDTLEFVGKMLNQHHLDAEHLFLSGVLMRHYIDMDMKKKEIEEPMNSKDQLLYGKQRILKLYFNNILTPEAIKLLNIWYYLNESVVHADFFSYDYEKLADVKNVLLNHYQFMLNFYIHGKNK